ELMLVVETAICCFYTHVFFITCLYDFLHFIQRKKSQDVRVFLYILSMPKLVIMFYQYRECEYETFSTISGGMLAATIFMQTTTLVQPTKGIEPCFIGVGL
ncbi:hypothetical protein ACJX0J_019432, partial [Zea mays]